MSQTHDIDNNDLFFFLDTYEQPNGSRCLEGSVQEPQLPFSSPRNLPYTPSSSTPSLPSQWYYDQLPTSDEMMNESPSNPSKGKGISQPLFIQGRDPIDVQIDALQAVGSSTAGGYSLAHTWAESSQSVESSPVQFAHYPDPTLATDVLSERENVEASSAFSGKGKGKGKGREQPPVLSPLVFTPMPFDYGSTEWPSFDTSPQTAGPSSYGSGFMSVIESIQNDDVTPPVTPEQSASPEHVATRRRSLSNLSIRSTRSLSALSISKVKVKFASTKGAGNIARKLLFKKRNSESPGTNSPTPAHAITPDRVIDPDLRVDVELGRGSCFLPWARDLKSCTSPPQGTLVDIDVGLIGGLSPLTPLSPIYRLGPPSSTAAFRGKGRSYSSPFPLGSSPLDIVPVTPADLYEPIPVDACNYFDERLPHELRILVFAALVDLYEADHGRNLSSGRWTAARAAQSRNRWVGAEKGVRELLKLSRVSKAWQGLVHDGQLWARLPRLPPTVLSRLCEVAGGFVKRVEFAGLTDLTSDALIQMTDNLCLDPMHSAATLSHTSITALNLQGCTALTTRALHYLLVRAPALQTLCVKGLSAVNNRTCNILSTHCRNLLSLDMSRCPSLDGDGIYSLAASTLERGETLRLRVLRLNWLCRVTDDMMYSLGKAAPNLEVLDLSYSSPLHNSAIEAFVALTEEEAKDTESIVLTAREAGRDPGDPNRYWRRVTRLRHLALSSCILLTDHACSHLAHAVPRLEFLELAGIGADLRDDGLVRLLDTTPYIRRVDLEDASDITDAVIAALTPRLDVSPSSPLRGAQLPLPQPGHALEHLVISYAANVTNEALLALVRNCTRLRTLEADNTKMNTAVMREFVHLSRKRKQADACLVAIDCRGISEHAVKDVAAHTRPRMGWRAWEARRLAFLDGRDEEGLGVGQDECDETRVVFKTFYSWQTVDAVRAAREKKRKAARRVGNGSGSSGGVEPGDGEAFASARTRWWSPGGRRSGAVSPLLVDGAEGREGCTIM